jgi:hypothetical protein
MIQTPPKTKLGGQFIADDPDTPEDEAWEDVPVPRPENAPDRIFL